MIKSIYNLEIMMNQILQLISDAFYLDNKF